LQAGAVDDAIDFSVGTNAEPHSFSKGQRNTKKIYWSSGRFFMRRNISPRFLHPRIVDELAVDGTNGRTEGYSTGSGRCGGVWEQGERAIRIRTGNLELLKSYSCLAVVKEAVVNPGRPVPGPRPDGSRRVACKPPPHGTALSASACPPPREILYIRTPKPVRSSIPSLFSTHITLSHASPIPSPSIALLGPSS
jgi:hypothetical protein